MKYRRTRKREKKKGRKISIIKIPLYPRNFELLPIIQFRIHDKWKKGNIFTFKAFGARGRVNSRIESFIPLAGREKEPNFGSKRKPFIAISKGSYLICDKIIKLGVSSV